VHLYEHPIASRIFIKTGVNLYDEIIADEISLLGISKTIPAGRIMSLVNSIET